MPQDPKTVNQACKIDAANAFNFRQRLPDLAEKIIASCDDEACYSHIDYEPLHSETAVIDIIHRFREILFPGYFGRQKLDPANIKYNMGQSVSLLFDLLSDEVTHSIRHDCLRYDQSCSNCGESGHQIVLDVFEAIPKLRQVLATDVRAFFEGDPAAKSYDEIIFAYPGVFAIMVYRVAHLLYLKDVPLLPRIMSEQAHSVTGIDIHPGAEIGEYFVIDHGTGVVIGETTEIGKNVRIYQGVTLGALSLPPNAGEQFRGKKRHPTIEDDVIIYSGATILGGDTIIGKRSVIGGNVWVTQSVPPDTRVIMETPKLIYEKESF